MAVESIVDVTAHGVRESRNRPGLQASTVDVHDQSEWHSVSTYRGYRSKGFRDHFRSAACQQTYGADPARGWPSA